MDKQTYEITGGGVYGVDGELPIGSTFEAASFPIGLEGRVRLVGGEKIDRAEIQVATPKAQNTGENGKPNYQAMTITDLKEAASIRQIDLGGATKKDDIIAKLTSADELGTDGPNVDDAGGDRPDRAQLEKSAATLGVEFTADTSDDDLYNKIQVALGDE